MRFPSLTKKKMAAVGAGAAILVGGGTAAAFAATGGSSTPAPAASPASPAPSSSSAAAHHHARGLAGLLDRADLATIEVNKSGSWVTETYQRGRITAVSPTSLTIERADGHSSTVALSSTTHYGGQGASESSLQVGQTVRVVSVDGAATTVSPGHAKASGATSSGAPSGAASGTSGTASGASS